MTDATITETNIAPTTIPTIAPVDNPFPLHQKIKTNKKNKKRNKIFKM